jgi:hypothetical protein
VNFRRETWAVPGLVILLVLVISGFSVVNVRISSKYTGTDSFLGYWVGTRLLLTEGVSPYSDEGITKAQEEIRKLNTESQPSQTPPIIFPLYASAIFLPFALVNNYLLARAIWMTALEIALIALAIISLRVTRWRLRRGSLILYFLFSFLWFHSIVSLITGNVVLLVAVFFTLSLLAIRSELDELAGLLLVLSTIKPLMVSLVILFILLWALIQHRWKVLVWFFGTLALLILGTMFFILDWPLQYIQTALSYFRGSLLLTPGDLLQIWMPGVGSKLGWILTGLLGIVLVIEWYIVRNKNEFRWFLWTSCLTLVAGQMIGFYTEPLSYIIFFLPLVEVFSVLEERWKLSGQVVMFIILSLLFVLPWAFFLRLLNHGESLDQLSILLFPLPLLLIIGLYWTRWWAIRPRRLYIETLREVEEMG